MKSAHSYLIVALQLIRCFSFDISFDVLKNKRILVVGGAGRVGGSVVTQLVQRGSEVVVGGTSQQNFFKSQARWKELFPEQKQQLAQVRFEEVDREKAESLASILNNHRYDLVVHTAGPFQGKVGIPNGVLQACTEASVPYVDVCDDYCTASAAKTKFFQAAQENNVPCIISTGCWPGVSSLMAKQLVQKTLEKYPNLKHSDLSVDFSFFTAGSGGAGVTLLVATFLILSEEALVIINGRRRTRQAMKEYSRVDFGKIIGEKDVAHMNLLETASIHDNLGVGDCRSLFGTAPNFWNALLGLMAQLPSSLLANEDIMRKLSVFSMPVVRLVDYFAGATNAMRCDVTSEKIPELRATAIYGHENLEPCVGECVTAFACAALSGAVKPGVWFPEEAIQAGESAAAVLHLASVGAHTTDVEAEGLNIFKSSVWGGGKEETAMVES